MANLWYPYDPAQKGFKDYGRVVSRYPEDFISVRNGGICGSGILNYSGARRRAHGANHLGGERHVENVESGIEHINLSTPVGACRATTGFRPIIRPEGDCVEDVVITADWMREKRRRRIPAVLPQDNKSPE